MKKYRCVLLIAVFCVTDVVVFGQGGKGNSSGEPVPSKFVRDLQKYEPAVVREKGMVVFFDYDEALAASKKLHKPVMLKFTGFYCVNCRKMESMVWSDPGVARILKNDFIIASLYCDADKVKLPKDEQYLSKDLKSNVTILGDMNGANPLPQYFFVDDKGKKLEEKGYSYDPDPEKFVAYLENVKAKYKKML